MADFASLGIKITSTGVNETKTALDSLVNSARTAQTVTDNLTQSNVRAEQGNKNATNSYYDMVAKLSQSKSAYESLQMGLKGYTDAQISHINALKSQNEALRTSQSYQDAHNKTVSQATAYYQDAINKIRMSASEYRDNQMALRGLTSAQIAHINSLESETRAANEATAAQQRLAQQRRSAQSSFISGMSAGAQVNPYSNVIAGGMSQSGAAAVALQAQTQATAQLESQQSSLLSRTFALNSAFSSMAYALSAVALYQTAKDVIMLADKMTLLDSRVKIATKSNEDYTFASKELVAISLRTGTSLEANYTIFARINQAMEGLGGNVKNTTVFVETLSQGLRISGASAGEASSTIRQMSQAMSSGVLRGDEFNSVMENSPRLARALADGLHVSIGSLRLMAETGQLTSKKVIEAIQSQASVMKAEYDAIPLTIGAALQNVNTEFSVYISNANKATGATHDLALGFDFVAKNMTSILDAIVTLGEIGAGVLAGKLLKSLALYIAASYDATVATSAQMVATAELAATEEVLAVAETEAAAAGVLLSESISTSAAMLTALNGAIAIFVAYKLTDYLKDYISAQDVYAFGLKKLLIVLEDYNYALEYGINLATGNINANEQLNKDHENRITAINGLQAATDANNGSKQDDIKLTGEQSSILESLKTPQEVYTSNLSKINEMLDNGKMNLVQYTLALKNYQDQLNQSLSAGKQSEIEKAIDKLKKKKDELTLSTGDNAKKQAESMGGASPELIKQYQDLSVELKKLEEGKKANTKADRDLYQQAKQLEDSYKSSIYNIQKEIALRGDSSKSASLEYEMINGSLKDLSESKQLYLLQQASELDNYNLIRKGDEATKNAMDAENMRYKELTLSAHDLFVEKLRLAKVPEDQIPIISAKHDINLDAESKNKAMEDAHSSLEKYHSELKSTNDSLKDLGATSVDIFDGAAGGISALTGALNAMVKSVNSNANAFAELGVKQKAVSEINLDKKSKTYLVDLKSQSDLQNKYANDYNKLNQKSLNDSIDGIRQVASATAQMFEKNSTEAKAFNLIALAGLAAKAAAAVLTQGEGDPYTAFARIAAMAALVSGIVSTGGGGGFNFSGGSNVSPGPQGLSGDTGTILGGDSSTKSNSVGNVYTLLQDIHADEYATLRSIDKGIGDLHSGITDVITRLFQAGGLTDVATPLSKKTGIAGAFGTVLHANPIAFDPILEWLLGSMFGGKQTSKVIAQGITTGATSISDIMAGGNLNAQQFAQIETKTSGGWFSNDKYKTSNQYAALDSDTQKALNGVFKSMGDTMLGLADNLGLGLSDRVKNYIIPALTVDLKGLDGEAAAKKLNGVISAALDTMSTAVFGDILGQYQKLGEGMLETAVRIVSEVAVVKDSLDKSGLSIAGDAIAISDALVQAAGGLKEFQKAFDDYYQKFYTDAERNVFSQKLLNTQLSDLNLLLPSTREEYRKLIESLNVNNSADAQRYSLLIKLSGAADSYYKILEDQANNLAQLAQQQRSLDIQYMELTGNAIGALTEKRKDELAAMDISLRFSQQSVWVMAAANKAVDDAMNVLKKSVSDQKALNNTAYQSAIAANNVQKQSANDLLSALKTVAANLKSALQSTVIESDDFVRQRRIAAQTVLTSALSSAASGGSLANYAGLDKALVDIAKPSEQLYTSFIDFARDQGRTGNVISRLSDYTSSQVSVAEQTLIAIEANNKLLTDGFNAENTRLDALVANGQSQVDAINGTTAVVMTVADAVANLSAVMNAKMTIERAVAVAKNAEGREFDAKSVYDAANQQAAKSQQAVNDAIATANKAAQAANAAQLTAQKGYGAAPTTYVNGQSGNPIWEQILSGFNAAHQARFGTPMNRAWGSDSDAQNQYQQLVAQYNINSAAAVQAALANAAGLANVANASAALIPGYQATALADSQSAAQAAAAYATASAYATAAKAAVPGINSFAIGTNYVESDRWAMVHQGERIMPAADNEQLFNIMSNTNNNKSSDAEIRLLRQEMAKLQVSNAEIARTNKKMADILVNVTMDGQAVLTTPA